MLGLGLHFSTWAALQSDFSENARTPVDWPKQQKEVLTFACTNIKMLYHRRDFPTVSMMGTKMDEDWMMCRNLL